MNEAGISADSRRIRLSAGMQPRLHRVEVEDAVAHDHDLAVERRARREELAERRELGEVAKQRARVARPEVELARGFSSTPRKPSHFGSNCHSSPSGSARTSSASIGGNGTIGSRSAGRSTGSLLRRARAWHRGRRYTGPSYALGSMRTRCRSPAFGAVTPSGSTRRRPGSRRVSGTSGVGWIEAFDASSFPVRIAAEVQGVRPGDGRSREGGAADGAQRPLRRRRGAGGVGRRGARGHRPEPRRDRRRLGDRRDREDRRAARGHARARRRPGLAVLHPLRARRHRERPDRDPARAQGAELRARLGVRERLDVGRRGGGARSGAGRRTSCSPAAPRRR